MVNLCWLIFLFSIFRLTTCMSFQTIESSMIKTLGDPYGDCMDIIHCTNCKGTGLVGSFRTFDGTCNQLTEPLLGATMTKHQRLLDAEYANGTTSFPRGFPMLSSNLPSGHVIAQNVFSAANKLEGNEHPTSILFMIFGQFIDHDITQVQHGKTKEECPTHIRCSGNSMVNDFKYPCNPILMHDGSGCTKLTRTKAACQKNGNKDKTREQVNTITSFIDGSAVYGSSDEQALNLRLLDGSGKLRMQKLGLLPLDTKLDEMCNMKEMHGCFAAGDARSSEHIGLAAFHTIWAREHNRIAEKLKEINFFWSGSMIYYTARRIVIAEIQHILYNEWIPKLVDLDDDSYKGYEPTRNNPAIANAFAHAAYRFGHTLVPNSLPQLDKDFNYVRKNIGLREAFFNIKPIMDFGIDSTVLGMVGNESETIDGRFADAIARHLFTRLNDSILEDLSAINIHRGRDHGLPSYYKWRKMCTGDTLDNWDSLQGIIKESDIEKLREVYSHVQDIDLFVGGILEIPDGRKLIGKTFGCIIKKQFEKLRRGDRFFYRNSNVFTSRQLDSIESVTMRQILCDNLDDVTSLHDDVFLAYKRHRRRSLCIKSKNLVLPDPRILNLNLWEEKIPPINLVITESF